MSSHKYVDHDVRNNPDLMARAVQYARQYHGDFEFMQAAAALSHATGTLPVGVARGVLNCMRVDPVEAATLPEPYSDPFSPRFSEIINQGMPGVFTRRERKLHSVPAPEPARRLLHARVKPKFAYTWSSVEPLVGFGRYHILSAELCNAMQWQGDAEMIINIGSLCGIRLSNKNRQLGNTPPSDYIECKSCVKQIMKEVQAQEK